MPIGKIKNRSFKTHRLGTIRLGIRQKKGDKEFPKDVPHFVLDEVPELKEVYGEEPTELDIMFISNDEDLIINNYLMMYRCENPFEKDISKRRSYLACRGEGLDPVTGEPTMAYWYDTNKKPSNEIPVDKDLEDRLNHELNELRSRLTAPDINLESRAYLERVMYAKGSVLKGTAIPRRCFHDECPDFIAKNCKPIMTLSFKVLEGGNIFGEYCVKTSSIASMSNVLNCIENVRQTIRSAFPNMPFGAIANIPLKLKRVEKQIRFTDANGVKRFSTHWPLQLEVNSLFAQKFAHKLQQAVKRALIEPVSSMALPSPELGGASPIDMETPHDLFPTPEEQRVSEEVQAEEFNPELAKIDEKESWLEDPEVINLIREWEEKKGQIMPEGKKKATVLKYDSKEDLIAAIRKNLG